MRVSCIYGNQRKGQQIYKIYFENINLYNKHVNKILNLTKKNLRSNSKYEPQCHKKCNTQKTFVCISLKTRKRIY